MIEKVVWSVSTRPFENNLNRQNNKYEDFLYLFAMSYVTNKQWFKKTELVTDCLGSELLVNSLGLEFNHVHKILENMDRHENLFAYGKLIAYGTQDEPFMHVDYDVFWHKAPPAFILSAPFSTQSAEIKNRFMFGYAAGLNMIEENKIKMPDYWDAWHPVSYNCGFVGVNDLEFLDLYIQEAKKVAHLLKHLQKETVCIDLFYEQFTLSLLSKKYKKPITVLFKEEEISQDFLEIIKPSLNEFGYQHLIGEAKKEIQNMTPVKQFIEKFHPLLNQKIQKTLCDLK
jgi:hypothetical protein